MGRLFVYVVPAGVFDSDVTAAEVETAARNHVIVLCACK